MRRIRSWALVLPLVPLASTATAQAASIVFNYQPSQSTGYGSGAQTINTLGDHTTPLNFNDGTADGKMFQISLLPFGQVGARPDPVFENQPANPAINYMNVLNQAYGAKYEFSYIGFTGQNELNVQSYSVTASNGGLVGADLYAIYSPGRGDPPISGDLHWIQVLSTNWKLPPGGPSQPGVMDNKVDVDPGQATPYYDDNGGTAGRRTIDGNPIFNFYDIPLRNSALLAGYTGGYPLQWMAEDFLALDTKIVDPLNNKDMVFIYGGVEYGWQVSLLPAPSSLLLLATGVPLLFVYGLVRRRRRVSVA